HLEDVGLDLAADLVVAGVLVVDAELPQATAGFDLGLGVVTRQRLVDQGGAAIAGGHLHGAVAVGLDRLDLGDAVRGGVDKGHRDGAAVFSDEAAHARLPALDAIVLGRHGRVLRSAWSGRPRRPRDRASAARPRSCRWGPRYPA